MIDKKLLFKNDQIEIYDGQSEHIYYRGEECSCSFGSALTYNITSEIQLTQRGFIKNLWDVGKVVFLAAIESDEYTSRKIITSREAFEEIFITSIGAEIPPDFNFPEHFSRLVKEKGALPIFVNFAHLAVSRGLIECQERVIEKNFTSFYSDLEKLCELYGVRLEIDGGSIRIPTNTLPLN